MSILAVYKQLIIIEAWLNIANNELENTALLISISFRNMQTKSTLVIVLAEC